MQSSDIPSKFSIPFADGAGSGYIRTIPTASQIGVNDGWASLEDGFPPLNATPKAAGGIPPFIQDMNGILKQISAWSRWVGAGGPVRYDSTFQTAIGGYPKGALVQSAVSDGVWWVSLVENNVTNPDSGGAGWGRAPRIAATAAQVQAGTSDDVVVTPASLSSGGYDRLISYSHAANGGYRLFASGWKECWGSISIGANATQVVTLPAAVGFTSFFKVYLGPYVRNDASSQGNTGTLNKIGLTAFTIANWEEATLTVDWEAKGV